MRTTSSLVQLHRDAWAFNSPQIAPQFFLIPRCVEVGENDCTTLHDNKKNTSLRLPKLRFWEKKDRTGTIAWVFGVNDKFSCAPKFLRIGKCLRRTRYSFYWWINRRSTATHIYAYAPFYCTFRNKVRLSSFSSWSSTKKIIFYKVKA